MKRLYYELVDHGIAYSQDFPGCGTAGTDYDDVVTGSGDTFNDALEDAREQLANTTDLDARQIRAVARMERLNDRANMRVSAMHEVWVDASNLIAPVDYAESCDHFDGGNHGEYCEDCHTAAVDDSLEDTETPWYYVSLRFRLEKR
jgi:hypothetical protein